MSASAAPPPSSPRSLLAAIPAAIADGTASAPLFGVDALYGTRVGARCSKVYDGDTMRTTFLHNGIATTFKTRIMHIDTPELHPRHKAPAAELELEKTLAKVARDRARALLDGQLVCLHVIGKGDPYGRLLAEVTLADGRAYHDVMVQEKLAYPYEGATKKRAWWALAEEREAWEAAQDENKE